MPNWFNTRWGAGWESRLGWRVGALSAWRLAKFQQFEQVGAIGAHGSLINLVLWGGIVGAYHVRSMMRRVGRGWRAKDRRGSVWRGIAELRRRHDARRSPAPLLVLVLSKLPSIKGRLTLIRGSARRRARFYSREQSLQVCRGAGTSHGKERR